MTQQIQNLYQSLINVPFLNLGPVDNFAALQSEAIEVYNNTELLTMHSTNPKDKTYLNLSVEGIFDYKGLPEIAGHCDSCLPEYQVRGKLTVPFAPGERTRATEFSKKIPSITNFITTLLDHPGRARLSVLNANTAVGWHSHFYGKSTSTEITLHVPMVTNQQVLAEVGQCDFDALSSDSATFSDWFKIPEKIYSTHFTEGNIWLLNSRHSHRFVNQSDSNRIHLWITTFLTDNKEDPVNQHLYRMIQTAMDAYSGPLI